MPWRRSPALSSGDKKSESSIDRVVAGMMSVFVSCMVLALVVVILIQPQGCQNSTQQPVPTGPCEEQPPIECIADTIEQASSSQFEHYVYCACVTDDGLSKGYVAAIKRPSIGRKLPWIPEHG